MLSVNNKIPIKDVAEMMIPRRNIMIHPNLPASQPDNGAANIPIKAAGVRNSNPDIAASSPNPTL
ncbi:hypothetical protein D3C77_592870 [compost metagenome]